MVQVRAVIALLLHRFWRFATRFAVRLRGVGSRFLIRLGTSFQAALSKPRLSNSAKILITKTVCNISRDPATFATERNDKTVFLQSVPKHLA